MFKKVFILLSVSIFLVNCKSDGSGSVAENCVIGIQSHWGTPVYDFNFDLTNVPFDTPTSVDVNMSGGEICRATGLLTQASQCSGSFDLSNVTYISGGSGDPGCSALEGDTNYSINGGTLTNCSKADASDCVTYYEIAN